MNIYVAEFKPIESFDYVIGYGELENWWDNPLRDITWPIKKGSIIKVEDNGNPKKPDCYLIIRLDVNTLRRRRLTIPIDKSTGYIDLTYKDSLSALIPYNPYNNFATDIPYTLVTKGIITDYISFQWKDEYSDAGSFTLTIPASEETRDLLKEDRLLLIGDSNHAMIIESVIFNNNLKTDGYIMEVTGKSLESILNRRVAFPGQSLNTNVYKGENGMCKAIYDLVDHFFIHPEEIAIESSDGQKYFYYPERRVPFIVLPKEEDRYTDVYIKRPFKASVNKVVSKSNLLEIISGLCKAEQLGFKIEIVPILEDSTILLWQFSLYTGKDKSYSRSNKNDPLLLFSPVLKNVDSVATTNDNSNYRNVIFCGVEKSSDGYINLTTNGSEANYYNQKTGIDIVDKFNSGATSLITGVKNKLVTMLESSEVCYTGILFLALAASRRDKDYQYTVDKIKIDRSGYGDRYYLYLRADSVDRILTEILTDNNDTFYFKIILDKPSDIEVTGRWGEGTVVKCKVVRDKKITHNGVDYYYAAIYDFYNLDSKVGFYVGYPYSTVGNQNLYEFDDGWVQDSGPYGLIEELNDDSIRIYTELNSAWGGRYLILCDSRGEFLTTTSLDSKISCPINKNIPPNWDTTTNTKRYLAIPIERLQDTNNEILKYPTEYVSKSDAEKIYIYYKPISGNDDTYSNKLKSFKLSDVNEAVSEGRMDFKSSTAEGWLTTPILRQAINDLNDTNFEKKIQGRRILDIFKKSALQAWFKTFDKYTSTNSQKRWLCQVYEYSNENSGIDRREVFVEEDNSDSDEWNISAINQFQSSTATISVDQEEDEESDEKINERLMESARKRSGDYRKIKNIDALMETESYEYLSENQNGYMLGDIVQVDDGWDNLDKFIISSATISNDTSSGLKKVPKFERYEDIPKEYAKLDYLQVANMILPAKFNRKFGGEENASELSLKSNFYFGITNDNYQGALRLNNISNIFSESVGVITDIECELQYVQRAKKSEEENPPDLSPNFALISAIGSQKRNVDANGNETRYAGINLPFALLSTTYKSPFYFMTEYNANDYPIENSNNRYFYMYIDNRSENVDNDLIYNSGVGYKNKCLIDWDNVNKTYFKPEVTTGIIDKDENEQNYYSFNLGDRLSDGILYEYFIFDFMDISDSVDLDPIVYRVNDAHDKNTFIINKIVEDNPDDLTIFKPSSEPDYDTAQENYPYGLLIYTIYNEESIDCKMFKDDWGELPLIKDLLDFENYDYDDLSLNHIEIYLFLDSRVLKYHKFEFDHGDFYYYDYRPEQQIEEIVEFIRPDSSLKYDVGTYELSAYSGAGFGYANIYFKGDNEDDLPEELKGYKYLLKYYMEDTTINGVTYKAGTGVFVVTGDEPYDPNESYHEYIIYNIKVDGKDQTETGVVYEEPNKSVDVNKEYEYNKTIYISKTFCKEDSLLSKKQMCPGYYPDNFNSMMYKYGDNINTFFINSQVALRKTSENEENYTILDFNDPTKNNILTDALGPNLKKSTIFIDETCWGQDNYRLPKYAETDDSQYINAYQDLLYENHIVIGGCGVYVYWDKDPVHGYTIKFYNYDQTENDNPGNNNPYAPLADCCPKACDTNNGVRIYGSIKIFETVCSARQIWFENVNNKEIYVPSNDNSIEPLCTKEKDFKAYYPDLSTRKLVHEYVPVRYTEGGNDLPKEEEYGLYDIVDKIFIPINWGNNDAATFIESGGEIKNE